MTPNIETSCLLAVILAPGFYVAGELSIKHTSRLIIKSVISNPEFEPTGARKASDHQPEVLALNQPSLEMLSSAACCGGGIWNEHKALAETPRRRSSRFSVLDESTDGDYYRHVLPRCDRASIGTLRDVVGIQNLAVIILNFVMCLGHLLLKKLLHYGRVGYDVAVVDDDW